MANTLPSLEIIAQQALDTLQAELPLADAFSTDFSADALVGGTVKVAVATAPTVGSVASGYASNVQDATANTVSVTVGPETGVVLGFTQADLANAGYDVSKLFVVPAINAVSANIIGAAMGLITAANYGNVEGVSKLTVAAADFDDDDVVKLAGYLSKLKAPKQGRSLILNSDAWMSLSADDSIKAAFAYSGNSLVKDGVVPGLRGFGTVCEYSDMPTNANMICFAAHKSAIAMASRLPAQDGWTGEQTVVKSPIGVPMLLRKWHSPDAGNKLFLSLTLQYGVAKGNSAIVRVLSA